MTDTEKQMRDALMAASKKLIVAAKAIGGEPEDAVDPLDYVRDVIDDAECFMDNLPRCRTCGCHLREENTAAICGLCHPEED